MAPILPLTTIFAVLIISKIKYQISKISSKFKVLKFTLGFALYALIFAMIIPGVAYLSVYQNPDARFQASNWIYKNIPNNSYILSETANVVDIPIINQRSKIKDLPAGRQGQKEFKKNYKVISFNFYDLDENPELQSELKKHLEKADYIFVPSRRIFTNHYCEENDKSQMTNNNSIINNKCQMLKQKYPLLNNYYYKLFSGKLGFTKVAEFESYPKICLFNARCLTFKDEQAEETWSVFDHPVIRIYKRVRSF